VQFASQFSIFVCVARIFDLASQWHSGGGKIACTRQCGQIRAKSATKSFSRTRAFLFLVKKIFGRDENKISNKVHFFLVDFESDFYSQARWREKNKNACE
jgi:hypothetical protein